MTAKLYLITGFIKSGNFTFCVISTIGEIFRLISAGSSTLPTPLLKIGEEKNYSFFGVSYL